MRALVAALKPYAGVPVAVVLFAIPANSPCAPPASPAVKYTVLGSPPLTDVVPPTLVPPGSSSQSAG